MSEFQECNDCAKKLGSPTLCEPCLNNRSLISRLEKEKSEAHDKGYGQGVDDGITTGKLIGFEKSANISENYCNRSSEGWGTMIADAIRKEIKTPEIQVSMCPHCGKTATAWFKGQKEEFWEHQQQEADDNCPGADNG